MPYDAVDRSSVRSVVSCVAAIPTQPPTSHCLSHIIRSLSLIITLSLLVERHSHHIHIDGGITI